MTDSRPVIEIQNLAKAFGYLPVLKKINLTIQRGQFVALLGPNGSGKSTLLRLICGLSKPTVGTISVGGWSIPGEAEAIRAQIGFVSHKALLYNNLTAQENLAFYTRLYHLQNSASRIDLLLGQVGLSKRAHSLVRTFSRGMQQRLSIARALLHEPHVLLFDEPFTGLDQDAAVVLDNLLLEAYAEGHTILMTTHQLERAARLANRIVILSRGTIAYDSTDPLDALQLSTLYAEKTGAANAR
ncbi:MAG: heme ABC exporter ATP-binding protein CcmA [Anaerolineae bacterium]|nr:heme ABC exporter ATP-binding protein CcmA [Anaerolineae bacterium]